MYKPQIVDRGYFGVGIYSPKTGSNMGLLMRSAFAYGADFVFTIGCRYQHEATDTPHADKHIPLFHYKDEADFLEHMPENCPLVGVELVEGASYLNSYSHLERSCYLLGAEDTGIPDSLLKKCDSTVVIPYTKMCLNVSVAGSIIIHDRIMKRSQWRPQSNRKTLIKDWDSDF